MTETLNWMFSFVIPRKTNKIFWETVNCEKTIFVVYVSWIILLVFKRISFN
jgi:hypothetical protein